jgi:hypothetical protein
MAWIGATTAENEAMNFHKCFVSKKKFKTLVMEARQGKEKKYSKQ